jgi:hypothetical protein
MVSTTNIHICMAEPRDGSIQNGSGMHTGSYSTAAWVLLWGVKWPECQVDHSLPSIADVKNEWSYTATPSVCLWWGWRKLYLSIWEYGFQGDQYVTGLSHTIAVLDVSVRKIPTNHDLLITQTLRINADPSLRRGSPAVRLLELRVRIPPQAWISVSCECCVLSSTGSCVWLITHPKESYRVWCVWVWSWSFDNEDILAP